MALKDGTQKRQMARIGGFEALGAPAALTMRSS